MDEQPVKGDGARGAGPASINAWDSYDTVFLNAKAGMDGVDKKKVQKVVYDMSKGSKYFINEQRKEADVVQRIERMNARAASLTPAQLADHEKATDFKIAELEAARDLSRVWMHVDMDAFYAAVEELVDPTLVGKPLAVGGMSMICTANYEARKFGVRAAMPGFIARKLCPSLMFVRPDFKKYSHYSELTREVFRQYDPDFVARSLDEAFVDITASCQSRNMSAEEVAEELRSKVHSATGLTCSAGVGPNRLIAKVCSDINKPNGQYVLRQERLAVMKFVSSLPIRKVNGIGKVTERLLKEVLEISTCADLLSKRALVSALFSEVSTVLSESTGNRRIYLRRTSAESEFYQESIADYFISHTFNHGIPDFLLAVGLGIGGSETPEKEDRKSLSNERTFAAISDDRQLFKKLEELVELLVNDMQKEDLQGRTLTLKLKETGFEVRSRAVTLPNFISTKPEIWEQAAKLLKRELPLSVRLMGLRISHFKDEKPDPSQRTLKSFMTQPGGPSGVCRARLSSDCPDKASCSSSGGRHEPAPQGRAEGLQFPATISGENTRECSPDSNTGMPEPASPSGRTAQNASFRTPQARPGNPAAPDVPQKSTTNTLFKNIRPAQTKMEDDLQVRDGLTSGAEELKTSLLSSVDRGGIRSSKETEPIDTADVRWHSSSGAQSCQITSCGGGKSEMRRADTAKAYDTTPKRECKISVFREGSHSRILEGFQQEDAADSCAQLKDSTMGLNPSWEALQSSYDSVQDQIWTDDGRCGLCGIEVSDHLRGARQEHEDYHFAVWLQQQQSEENGSLQRSGTTPTSTVKKTSRPGVERDSRTKRKASNGKVQRGAKRTGAHRPLEAFFSKANC